MFVEQPFEEQAFVKQMFAQQFTHIIEELCKLPQKIAYMASLHSLPKKNGGRKNEKMHKY